MARKKSVLEENTLPGEAPPDTDYSDMLIPPVAPDDQCPHTAKAMQKSECSICAGWVAGAPKAPAKSVSKNTKPSVRPRVRR